MAIDMLIEDKGRESDRPLRSSFLSEAMGGRGSDAGRDMEAARLLKSRGVAMEEAGRMP